MLKQLCFLTIFLMVTAADPSNGCGTKYKNAAQTIHKNHCDYYPLSMGDNNTYYGNCIEAKGLNYTFAVKKCWGIFQPNVPLTNQNQLVDYCCRNGVDQGIDFICCAITQEYIAGGKDGIWDPDDKIKISKACLVQQLKAKLIDFIGGC